VGIINGLRWIVFIVVRTVGTLMCSLLYILLGYMGLHTGQVTYPVHS